MKKFSFLILFILASCRNLPCCEVSEWKQEEAQKMYENFGAFLSDISVSDARKIFGNCYKLGDEVYVYNNLWSKKYILVRYSRAVTYEEVKK